MSTRKWLSAGIALFVVSATVGWFVPDGLNWLLRQFGRTPIPVSPLERLFSFMISFSFATAMQLIIWVRGEVSEAKVKLPPELRRNVFEAASVAMEGAVLNAILAKRRSNLNSLVDSRDLMTTFAEAVIHDRDHLVPARNLLIQRSVSKMNEDLRSLHGEGMEVELLDHVEISRRLAFQSSTYLQIQRKTFQVPGEWTTEWMKFVDEIGHAKGISAEYIVLLPKKAIATDAAKLDSMRAHLSKRSFSVRYCELEKVLDSLGGKLPTDWNVEVFGNQTVKLQSLPAGRYHGGVSLRMSLHDLRDRGDLQRLVDVVLRCAERFTSKH